jgi:hypothetical protein
MPDPGIPKRTRTIGIVLAVAAVGAIVAYALLQQTPPPPAAPLAVVAATPTPTPVAAESLVAQPVATPAASASPAVAAQGPQGPDGNSPAWESTIDGILRSNVSDSQMAQLLINILPTLPEDGQIEAANHIANLLPDSEYSSVKPLLLNSNLPESVLSVFFTDLMNRDDPTKLNTFLDIAQIPNHPFQSEALSDLQIYVGDDYGTDWGKWKSAVDEYLKTANAQ